MLSPHQIAERLEQELTTLDELVEEIKTTAGELAHAEALFKKKFAGIRMTARAEMRGKNEKYTQDMIEDEAVKETERERLDYLIAQQTMTYLREARQAAQTRVDALRTMSAAVRGAGG